MCVTAPEPINYAYIGILVPIILLIVIIILIWYCCCYNKEVKYMGTSQSLKAIWVYEVHMRQKIVSLLL